MKGFGSLALCVALVLGGCEANGSTSDAIDTWDGQPLNSYQRGVAADGVVTRAEYDDAYERARTCVVDEGWTAEVAETPSGGLQLQVAGSVNADASLIGEVIDGCMEAWVGALEPIYTAAAVARGAERDAEFVEWQDCMTSQGGDVTGVVLGMPQDELVTQLEVTNGPYSEWPLALATCVEKYYFTLWPEMIPGA